MIALCAGFFRHLEIIIKTDPYLLMVHSDTPLVPRASKQTFFFLRDVTMMYKCVNNLVPAYISCKIGKRSTSHAYNRSQQ